MNSNKICFFMHWFSDGGAEKMTILLANALSERGYEVSFLLRHNFGIVKEDLSPSVKILDMKLPQKGRLCKNLLNVYYLIHMMRSDQAAVLFSVTAEMSQVAAAASWLCRRKMPLISVVHNALSQEVHSFQRVREWLFPIVNRQYDRVVAVSEAVAEDYRLVCHSSPGQVCTIYNPVVSGQLLKLSLQDISHEWLREDRSFRTLVQAGRLSWQKNHRLMLEALKLLRKEEDYRLLILGIGELEDELKTVVQSMGLEQAVEFAGYIRNPYPYFRCSDAVVLSSRFEGLPTVLIEALACGSRVVSVDCPCGPAEILKNGEFGFLAPMDDPAGLADSVKRSMETEPDRERLRGRAMDFALDAAVDGYTALIEAAVSEWNGRKTR